MLNVKWKARPRGTCVILRNIAYALSLEKLNLFIVWKYFLEILQKNGWKIQSPKFCPIPWCGNVVRGEEIF